jgi:hypothetical protein
MQPAAAPAADLQTLARSVSAVVGQYCRVVVGDARWRAATAARVERVVMQWVAAANGLVCLYGRRAWNAHTADPALWEDSLDIDLFAVDARMFPALCASLFSALAEFGPLLHGYTKLHADGKGRTLTVEVGGTPLVDLSARDLFGDFCIGAVAPPLRLPFFVPRTCAGVDDIPVLRRDVMAEMLRAEVVVGGWRRDKAARQLDRILTLDALGFLLPEPARTAPLFHDLAQPAPPAPAVLAAEGRADPEPRRGEAAERQGAGIQYCQRAPKAAPSPPEVFAPEMTPQGAHLAQPPSAPAAPCREPRRGSGRIPSESPPPSRQRRRTAFTPPGTLTCGGGRSSRPGAAAFGYSPGHASAATPRLSATRDPARQLSRSPAPLPLRGLAPSGLACGSGANTSPGPQGGGDGVAAGAEAEAEAAAAASSLSPAALACACPAARPCLEQLWILREHVSLADSLHSFRRLLRCFGCLGCGLERCPLAEAVEICGCRESLAEIAELLV